MTRDEVVDLLRRGDLRIAFDTNALWNDRKLIAVCTDFARWNDRLTKRGVPEIKLLVCAAAHAEKVVDLKQTRKETFDRKVIFEGLKRKGLTIQPFDASHALATGDRLGAQYPDEEAWKSAKKRRYMQSLGLNPTRDSVPGTGSSCYATIDWLIAGHAVEEQCILVTNDTGVEFQGLAKRVKLDTLHEAVRQLVDEPA